jgi:SAM-dependent methyltransferase
MRVMSRLVTLLRSSGLSRFALHALSRLGLLEIAFKSYQRALTVWYRSTHQAYSPLAAGLPIPPPALRVLVAGSPDVDSFLQIGQSMFQAVRGALEQNGVQITHLTSVLEFGCGCGRVLRHWHAVPGPEVHGVDYNARLIAWCHANLPFACFSTNSLNPPLPHEDGRFDLVYAISVFTHLSADLQLSWMRELRRVIRPGGHLIITTHGASCCSGLTQAEYGTFAGGNVVVRYQDASGMNVCSAYHPEAYVRRRLSAGYTVLDFIPAGAKEGVYQDLYLMRNGPE